MRYAKYGLMGLAYILLVLCIIVIGDYIHDYESPPDSPEESHVDAVDQVHRGFHKGSLPHPWFHQMPAPTKQRRMGI